MAKEVLVDASSKFAVKREAAMLYDEDGLNEVELITDTVNEQVNKYIDAVDEYAPEVATALKALKANGMGKILVPATTLEDQAPDERLLPTNESFVVYRRELGGPLTPELLLPLGMITTVRSKFYPSLTDPGVLGSEKEIASATTASVWYGLGKWTIDTIDPRNVDNIATSVPALKAISVLAGVEVEEADSESQESNIADSLTVLSYRTAGAMAYKGLARYLKAVGNGETIEALGVCQGTMSAFYDLEVDKNPAHVTPLNFALAKPLFKHEVEGVFQTLDPVAKELRDNNRLITLEY